MLRHTNSTRSSIRSVPLDHLDSHTASRDAHIAATHAFSRARERTSNSSDNMFPTLYPTGARPLEPDTTSPTGLKCQQSVRFVNTRHTTNRASTSTSTSTSSDMASPTSIDTLKPENIMSPRSALDMGYSQIPDLLPYIDPPTPTRDYMARFGMPTNSSIPDCDDASLPSDQGIRRSKSLFTQTKQSPVNRQGGGGTPSQSVVDMQSSNLDGSGSGRMDRNGFGPQSLRAPKSASVLAPPRDQLEVSREAQVRGLAIQLARDKWNKDEADSQRTGKHKPHHHLPSLFSRSNNTKDMNKSLRTDDQSQANLPFSLSQHNSPQEASLRHKARKASHNFRNKLRGLFKNSNVGAEGNYLPEQHVECKGTHVTDVNGSRNHTPTESVAKLRNRDSSSVSRVPSGLASIVDVPEHQLMRSRQGSIDEFNAYPHIDDDKSRVTSWTSSGATASSSQSGNTWAEWDKSRYSTMRDSTSSRLPSSPLASPGLIVDSQRVYSALIKKLDENCQLGRIEEQKGLEGSPMTIRAIPVHVEEEDNVFSSPSRVGRRARTTSPVGLGRYIAEDIGITDGNRDGNGNNTGIASIHPISHLDNAPQPPPKIMTNRQSAFFGSPTCHLFRTQSPYRRALQRSLQEEQGAPIPLKQRSMTLDRPPTNMKAQIPAGNGHQDQESGFYDSSSVYSNDSLIETGTSLVPEHMPDAAQTESSHGKATIYLNPPTYCPPIHNKGRIVSNASSVEWKGWLSSHVSKLEEHESPTRNSPNLGSNIYSPAIMSPSSICQPGHARESVQLSSNDSGNIAHASTPTPRPLRLRISSRGEIGRPLTRSSGNIRTRSSTTPRRIPPTPPIQQKTQYSPASGDENTHPESKQPVALLPPPIPAKNPLRKTSSQASIPTYPSRSPTPTRTTPITDVVGNSGTSTPRDNPLHSMRSFSGLKQRRKFNGQSRKFSDQRRISNRLPLQMSRERLTEALSCASSPGFPVLDMDGQLVVGKNRNDDDRPLSQDGGFRVWNRHHSPIATPVKGMVFIPGGSKDMVETFLSKRRQRMASSGEDSAFV